MMNRNELIKRINEEVDNVNIITKEYPKGMFEKTLTFNLLFFGQPYYLKIEGEEFVIWINDRYGVGEGLFNLREWLMDNKILSYVIEKIRYYSLWLKTYKGNGKGGIHKDKFGSPILENEVMRTATTNLGKLLKEIDTTHHVGSVEQIREYETEDDYNVVPLRYKYYIDCKHEEILDDKYMILDDEDAHDIIRGMWDIDYSRNELKEKYGEYDKDRISLELLKDEKYYEFYSLKELYLKNDIKPIDVEKIYQLD